MSTATYSYTGTLTIVECATCHMDFGVVPFFHRARRDDHATFYCPAGHRNYYSAKSAQEQLQEERDAALRQRDAARVARDAARDQAEAAERRRRAAKGQLTKVKKRVAHGVCPCCNRTFADLARHMSSKHPDYATQHAAPEAAKSDA